MSKHRKLPRTISYALTGWLAGVAAAIFIVIAWPIIFPAIVRPEHYYGDGPGLLQVLITAILIMTPAAAVGGIVGGRLSIEGGDRGQRVIAVIFAVLFSLPFTCYIFWLFTGF